MISRMVSVFRKKKEKKKNDKCDITKKRKKEKGLRFNPYGFNLTERKQIVEDKGSWVGIFLFCFGTDHGLGLRSLNREIFVALNT